MNNRITQLFETKKESVLNIYFTAGYPALEDTTRILKALEKSGADLVEIGVPFSDPLADGPTIQASGQQALDNGMTLEKLLTLEGEWIRKGIDEGQCYLNHDPDPLKTFKRYNK